MDIMVENIVFFDVETPNRRNDRISSLGIIVIQNGKELFRNNFLINPECEFDDFNIELTGITPSTVKNAPTLPEVWRMISQFFFNSLVVGHNVSFDLAVLDKALSYYDLVSDNNLIYYADTLNKAREVYNFGSYKLNVVCENLHLNLGEHHHALDDACACGQLYYRIMKDAGWSSKDIRPYQFGSIKPISDKETLTKAGDELFGIFIGIGIDKIINQKEISAIKKWMQDYQKNSRYDGFTEIYRVLYDILEDNSIDYNEYQMLLEVLRRSNRYHYSDETIAINILKGVMKGILSDGIISDKELFNMNKWLANYDSMRTNYPFDVIFSTVEEVVRDGVITAEEIQTVKEVFSRFLDPVSFVPTKSEDDEPISLKGKSVCITGTCISGSRTDVQQRLIDMGALIVNGVTKKTDYLLVGGEGSEKWAYGNYGGKIKKALELQNKGSNIVIIGEKEIFDT